MTVEQVAPPIAAMPVGVATLESQATPQGSLTGPAAMAQPDLLRFTWLRGPLVDQTTA